MNGCLSRLRLSQLALGNLAGAERSAAEGHAAQCARCRDLLAEERASIRADAYAPVPKELLDAAERRSSPPWRGRVAAWAGALAAAAACAVVGLVVVPRVSSEDGERLKGPAAVELAIERDGALLTTSATAERPPLLRPGDRVRVRVLGPRGTWVKLEGLEDGLWRRYFAGGRPEDGWLPAGVRVTADGRTQLRVSICPGEPRDGADEACAVRVYPFSLEQTGR